jgi:hypothetical protein
MEFNIMEAMVMVKEDLDKIIKHFPFLINFFIQELYLLILIILNEIIFIYMNLKGPDKIYFK